jgi:hypothetical protein
VQLFPLEMQNVAKCCKIQQNPMIHHHVLLLLAQKIMQVWPAPTVPAPWSKDHALSAALCYCNRLSKKVAFPLEISREHVKVCKSPPNSTSTSARTCSIFKKKHKHPIRSSAFYSCPLSFDPARTKNLPKKMRSLTRSQHMVKKNQRETNRKSASRYHKHAHRHLDSKSHEPHGLLVPIPWYLVNILKMNRNPKRTKYVKMFTIVYLEISGRFGLTHDHTRIRTSEWITWAHQRLCALAVPQCLNSPSQSALDKI